MFLKTLCANIIFLCVMHSLYAQNKDSIISLDISDKIEVTENGIELRNMNFIFFDTHVKQFYYQFTLNDTKHLSDSTFLFLEIKKKSNMQYKLRPLYRKKITLQQLRNLTYTDSVDLNEARLGSGNFEVLLHLMTDSSKVLQLKKTAFQSLRDATEKVKDEYYELQTSDKGAVVDIEKTFVSKYDIETLKRFIVALKPISKGVEEKVLFSIIDIDDIKFLRQFFYNFWTNRDASNPESEWKKYAEKLNYVAKQYGNGSIPGHQTDRGRIYLQYGEPDKIERAPSEKDAYPYEIWFYKFLQNKTNVSFLFYQPGMVGTQMFLLHSNFDAEIRNPYWKETLLADPANGDNKLMHRVFEYFK